MVIGSHPRAVFPCAVAAVPPTKASACTISREILDKSLGDCYHDPPYCQIFAVARIVLRPRRRQYQL